MPIPERFVEKPPHIDERRMRHISDEDLCAALALPQPVSGLTRRAARRGERIDAPVTLDAWSPHFAGRQRPLPVTDVQGWARHIGAAGSSQAETIIRQATRLHAEPLDYADPSKGKSGLYGFHYMQWMRPLIDAYALTRDEAHVQAFARLFNDWYETRDRVRGQWQPDVIWYTLGLAIRSTLFTLAYHTFRGSPALDIATQARLLKTVLGACRWLAEEHDTFRYGNWQLHGVAHLLQLALFWPEFREAPAWRAIAEARLWDHLALDVYPDGGHHERSAGYHSGVVENYGQAALALDLAGDPRLRQAIAPLYHWLVQQCSPLGWAQASNDSGFVWVGPFAARGAVICADPELKSVAEQLGSPEEIAAALATIPTLPDGRTPQQSWNALVSRPMHAGSVLLPTSKFAIMRSGLGPDDLFMAITYGPWIEHELESHSHNDPLSFVCAGLDVPLAVEAGGPATYDDPEYYQWYQAARAHNVVLVDGQDPNTHQRDAQLLHWSTSPVADLFAAEHGGYLESKGITHRRTILFARSTPAAEQAATGMAATYWVVHDELEQPKNLHRFGWLLHLPNEFTLKDGAAFPTAGPGLAVLPVAPRGGRLEERAAGMMLVPGPRAYSGAAERRMVRAVQHVVTSDAPRVALMHILYPLRAGEEPDAIRVQPLALTGAPGEACYVHTPAGADLVVLRDTSDASPFVVAPLGASPAADHWAGDALACLVRADGRLAAYEASSLYHAGVSLFSASAPLKSIALWPVEEGLAGEIVAHRKTTLRLRVPWPWGQVRLNDVAVPSDEGASPQDREAPDPSFRLPYGGVFRLLITTNVPQVETQG